METTITMVMRSAAITKSGMMELMTAISMRVVRLSFKTTIQSKKIILPASPFTMVITNPPPELLDLLQPYCQLLQWHTEH